MVDIHVSDQPLAGPVGDAAKLADLRPDPPGVETRPGRYPQNWTIHPPGLDALYRYDGTHGVIVRWLPGAPFGDHLVSLATQVPGAERVDPDFQWWHLGASVGRPATDLGARTPGLLG